MAKTGKGNNIGVAGNIGLGLQSFKEPIGNMLFDNSYTGTTYTDPLTGYSVNNFGRTNSGKFGMDNEDMDRLISGLGLVDTGNIATRGSNRNDIGSIFNSGQGYSISDTLNNQMNTDAFIQALGMLGL